MRCRNCGWDNQDNNSKCEKCNAPLTGTSNSVTENNNTHSTSSMQATSRENNSQKTSRHNMAVEDVKRTRREGEPETPPLKNTVSMEAGKSPTVCPTCDYLVSSSSSNCPMCGNDLAQPQPQKVASKAPDAVRKHTSTKKCERCANQIPSNVRFCPECGHPVRQQTINPWATATPKQETACILTPVAWEDEQINETPIRYSGEKIILNRDNTEPGNPNITSLEQAELTYEDGKWYIQDKSAQKTTFVYAGKRTMLEAGDIVILGNRKFEFKE